MNLIMSLLPIAVLIFLMTGKRSLSSAKALPLSAFLAWVLALGWFGRSAKDVHGAMVDGLLTAFTPILIVFGAIVLFRSMEITGAMETVKRRLNGISSNKVAQLMIVGWAFEFLIEGASGFGTPAALAAPILVGLGFPVLQSAAFALVMDSIPVSFGAVGTPTWFGFSEIPGLTDDLIAQIGWKTAVMNGAAALVVPLVALLILVDFRTLRRNLVFVFLSILATVIPYGLTALVSYEFPALAGGFAGLGATVLLASRGVGLSGNAEDEQAAATPGPDGTGGGGELLKALFPIWGTILLLILTRIPALGLKGLLTASAPAFSVELGNLGTFSLSSSLVFRLDGILGSGSSWSMALLYVPGILPFVAVALLTFLLYEIPRREAAEVFWNTLRGLASPARALFGALVLVNLLMLGGTDAPTMVIGGALAWTLGGAWTAFAAYLGALGAFFSGSNTISNLTFGGIQYSAAQNLGLNLSTVLAAQSAGGAMGNMVCIHNIVAVCSVLGLADAEGRVLRKTVLPMVVYGVIVGVIALIL